MSVGLAGNVISPAGYLPYFPLDRNALLGEVLRSVDGIIGPLSLFHDVFYGRTLSGFGFKELARQGA